MHTQLTFGERIGDDWALTHILDEHGKQTDYICVRNHIERYDKLEELLKTKKLIGLSANQNFPKPTINPHEYAFMKSEENNILKKYGHKIILWCHCFKDPQNFVSPGIPLLLLSDSDHYRNVSTLITLSKNKKEKPYDFFCSLPPGDWNTWIRGVDVARKWLNYMADVMNLKIVVGAGDRRDGFSDKIEFTGHLPWNLFTEKMNQCKYLFNASRYDASPRIIIEALALNIPVMLNQDILGGWKYINKSTGMLFFYDEPIEAAVQRFMKRQYTPQKWMELNFDAKKSKQLLSDTVTRLMSFKYEDFIDGIMFINLADRADRLEHMMREFNKAEIPLTLVHRIDAVFDATCGHLGCTRSHIKALEYAKEKGWKRFLVLEDDFQFDFPKERILYIISEFLKRFERWDVFMFATYWNDVSDTDVDYIKQIKYGTTTSGYMVNHIYADTLYKNFVESMTLLDKEVEQFKQVRTSPDERKYTTSYALDAYWFSLQKKDNFYISEPHLGKQSCIASSIMAR